MRLPSLVKTIALFGLCLCLSACGGLVKDDGEFRATVLKAMAKGSGAFNGTWNVQLRAKQNTCGLAIQKPVALTVAIAQSGSKAQVTISGLPSYKGTIRGSRLAGSGTYTFGTAKITGSLKATLSGKKKIVINSTRLNVTGSKRCFVTFSGAGTRA